MCIEIKATIIGAVVGSVIGGIFLLIGVYLGNRLARKAARDAAFANLFFNAAKEFKEKWIQVYIKTRQSVEEKEIICDKRAFAIAHDILKDSTFEISIIIFRRYLEGETRINFDRACEALYGTKEQQENHISKTFFIMENNTKEKELDTRQKLLAVLDQILSFTERK